MSKHVCKKIQDAKIEKMYNPAISDDENAACMKISKYKVMLWKRKNGFGNPKPGTPPKYNHDEIKRLILEDEHMDEEIAYFIGCSRATVVAIRHQLGIYKIRGRKPTVQTIPIVKGCE